MHYQLLKFPRSWLHQHFNVLFMTINVVYYVLVSLLMVNNLCYYVFNGHIFRSIINREVLISGGRKSEISIIELSLTYCFVHIILIMPIKF